VPTGRENEPACGLRTKRVPRVSRRLAGTGIRLACRTVRILVALPILALRSVMCNRNFAASSAGELTRKLPVQMQIGVASGGRASHARRSWAAGEFPSSSGRPCKFYY
jgi:hypothetical protein